MSKIRGKVVEINISNDKGTIKTPIGKGKFKADFGLVGDAHAGPGKRQVSLLAIESIENINKITGSEVTVGKFAENITTEGIKLYKLPIGTKIKISEVILEISQIGKSCHHGCAIREEIGDCVMPKEGVFAIVLVGGRIVKGDDIEIIEEV